jgi:integrase
MLKASLNHAYDEGHVASRDAWGRRLAPFEKVEVARVRYLTVAEAERLINGCEADFRALVRAGLETGCRYEELIRLEVCDFNPDAATWPSGRARAASQGTWCLPRRAPPSSVRRLLAAAGMS